MDIAQVPSEPLGRSERVYGGLLRAYPRAFRARYEAQMVLLFSDQLRDARAAGGAGGLATTWFRTLLDLASSALGEHLRKDRTMAQSIATFEPSRTMRVLGLVGIAGGLIFLWAYLDFDPFSERLANEIRLTTWWLGGAAIALALRGRMAAIRPGLVSAVTALVVFTGVWSVLWMLNSWQVPSPFSGTYGLIGFVANHLGFLSAAAFGAAILWLPAAWAGMGRWQRAVTQMAGLCLLLGGLLINVGDDHLGLVDSEPYGDAWVQIALFGQFLYAAAWTMLGSILLLARRTAPRAR